MYICVYIYNCNEGYIYYYMYLWFLHVLLYSTRKALSPGCQKSNRVLGLPLPPLRVHHLAPLCRDPPSVEPSHGGFRLYHWTMTSLVLFDSWRLMRSALWNCSSASGLLISWFPATYRTYHWSCLVLSCSGNSSFIANHWVAWTLHRGKPGKLLGQGDSSSAADRLGKRRFWRILLSPSHSPTLPKICQSSAASLFLKASNGEWSYSCKKRHHKFHHMSPCKISTDLLAASDYLKVSNPISPYGGPAKSCTDRR